ncbi:Tautomerase/MIF [Xylariaceae sp. FL1651]|nr:Tautomerase/MIF [Xylariaceae sp. FL1651]
MLENPLRRSARAPASNPAGIRRPDSPAIKPQCAGPPLAPPGASFAQRRAQRSRPPTVSLVEGNDVMRSIDRPLPGDVVGRRKAQLHPEASKKKSAYFESEFAAPNRGDDPAKARIRNEAMVTAELKTNVIIKDEFSFITDLAYHLSNRYQRPMSSINITLHHGICMLFGGSFEPACALTLYALPSLVQPATNKRNATIIQRHLQEALGIVPTRGYVRFEATPEENIAIGGKTLAAEVEELSKGITSQKSGMPRRPSKSGRGIINSVKSLGNFRSLSMIDLADKVPTPPPSNSDETTRIATISEVPPTPPDEEKSSEVGDQKPPKAASRRKSLRFALFGNKSSADK